MNKKLSPVSSIADSGSKDSLSDDELADFNHKEKKITQAEAPTTAQAVLEKSKQVPQDYLSKLKSLNKRDSKGNL